MLAHPHLVLRRCIADNYFVGPSLTLLRSKAQSNREVGVDRINRWHSSDALLPELVAQGAAESLLVAMPTAQPSTRITILELLIRMAPVGNARERLVANDAATRSLGGCSDMAALGSDAATVERCHTLATALGAALQGGESL
jgi:hypothetical protein